MKHLLNETYLYLLQNPTAAFNASRIGEETGKGRKTVGKQLQALREEGFITVDDKVINVYNIKNFYPDAPNKYIRALLILKDCDDIKFTSCEDISCLLGVSSKTLKPYYDEVVGRAKKKNSYDGPAVYQITPHGSDEIIYIGYTTNFMQRQYVHQSLITNMSIKSKLYQYCVEHNITQVDITTIIEHEDLCMLRKLESYLISTLKPVGNDTIT